MALGSCCTTGIPEDKTTLKFHITEEDSRKNAFTIFSLPTTWCGAVIIYYNVAQAIFEINIRTSLFSIKKR